jgi:hypothetical protein
MIKGFLNIPWFGWAAAALLIAIVFTFIWPHKAVSATDGGRYLAVRWAHALTWYLLALGFLLRGLFPTMNGMASFLSIAGGLSYLLFIIMTFVVK